MSKILTDISTYIFDKIDVVIVFLAVAGGMYIVNIILGSLNAVFTKEFDWKKHIYGIGKAVVACFTILAFCVLVNLFCYGLSMINISIPDIVVTIVEVIKIIVSWCYDLYIDISQKIEGLKDLKYIKYDDIKLSQINDHDVDTNIGGIL